MLKVHAKLNLGFPRTKRHSTIRRLLLLQNGLQFLKETCEALHLENSFVWFRNLDTSENSLDCSEMWCWRRTEKFSWTDRVKNEEVLH